MDAGKRSKAARGELCWVLPAGLERLRSGEVTLHPDEEIQARLRYMHLVESNKHQAIRRLSNYHEITTAEVVPMKQKAG